MNTFAKNTLSSLAAVIIAARAATIAVTIAATPVVAAQTTTRTTASAAVAAATKPGGPGDYLVHVGKRAVWASTLPKQEVSPLALGSGSVKDWAPGDRDYLVTVGKRTVLASQVPREPSKVSLPPTKKSKGHFVTIGKATFWMENSH